MSENKIDKFIESLKDFEQRCVQEIKIQKMETALKYFANPEMYKRWDVNGREMIEPVLVNGLAIATDALKDNE